MARPKKIPVMNKDLLCPHCNATMKVCQAIYSWTWARCVSCGKLFLVPNNIQQELIPINKYIVVTQENNTFSIMDSTGHWHRGLPNLEKVTLSQAHNNRPFRLFESPESAEKAINRLRNSENANYDWNSIIFYWAEVIVYLNSIAYTKASAQII